MAFVEGVFVVRDSFLYSHMKDLVRFVELVHLTDHLYWIKKIISHNAWNATSTTILGDVKDLL